jgi:hypothetical protein
MVSLDADDRTATTFLAATAGFLARIGRGFAVPERAPLADTGCISDAETLRELSRLDDHELLDVGVVRRKCGAKWRLTGREAAPPPIASYEYFRIGAETFPPS